MGNRDSRTAARRGNRNQDEDVDNTEKPGVGSTAVNYYRNIKNIKCIYIYLLLVYY